MAQADNDSLQLIEERCRFRAELTRLKIFYDKRGAIELIASLQARFDRNFWPLVGKFEEIHWRI